jgi:hypothetical protein
MTGGEEKAVSRSVMVVILVLLDIGDSSTGSIPPWTSPRHRLFNPAPPAAQLA